MTSFVFMLGMLRPWALLPILTRWAALWEGASHPQPESRLALRGAVASVGGRPSLPSGTVPQGQQHRVPLSLQQEGRGGGLPPSRRSERAVDTAGLRLRDARASLPMGPQKTVSGSLCPACWMLRSCRCHGGRVRGAQRPAGGGLGSQPNTPITRPLRRGDAREPTVREGPEVRGWEYG